MFYEGLERADLEAMLNSLTKEVGDEFMKLVIAKNPPNAMKRQVDWLHTMCCQKHTPETYIPCEYFEEEMLDDGWTKYDHRAWVNLWQDLTKLWPAKRLQDLIYGTMYVLKEIQVACDRDPDLAAFITKLLDQNPSLFLPIPKQTAPVLEETSSTEDDSTGTVLFPEE